MKFLLDKQAADIFVACFFIFKMKMNILPSILILLVLININLFSQPINEERKFSVNFVSSDAQFIDTLIIKSNSFKNIYDPPSQIKPGIYFIYEIKLKLKFTLIDEVNHPLVLKCKFKDGTNQTTLIKDYLEEIDESDFLDFYFEIRRDEREFNWIEIELGEIEEEVNPDLVKNFKIYYDRTLLYLN